MKLYEFKGPPSPRRVRIFLAEKGVEVEMVDVNIREGAQFSDEMMAKNPRCTIPFLELADGTVISEADSICRYFDDLYPDPPLFGNSAEERAVVNDWEHIIEIDGFGGVAEALRNSAERLIDRALTGPANVAQIPELAERGLGRIDRFFVDLDKQLEGKEFIAGDNYSVADVTGLVVVDFAKIVQKTPSEKLKNLLRWHAAVSARSSASA